MPYAPRHRSRRLLAACVGDGTTCQESPSQRCRHAGRRRHWPLASIPCVSQSGPLPAGAVNPPVWWRPRRLESDGRGGLLQAPTVGRLEPGRRHVRGSPDGARAQQPTPMERPAWILIERGVGVGRQTPVGAEISARVGPQADRFAGARGVAPAIPTSVSRQSGWRPPAPPDPLVESVPHVLRHPVDAGDAGAGVRPSARRQDRGRRALAGQPA